MTRTGRQGSPAPDGVEMAFAAARVAATSAGRFRLPFDERSSDEGPTRFKLEKLRR